MIVDWIVAHPVATFFLAAFATLYCVGVGSAWRSHLRDARELEDKRSRDELWKEE